MIPQTRTKVRLVTGRQPKLPTFLFTVQIFSKLLHSRQEVSLAKDTGSSFTRFFQRLLGAPDPPAPSAEIPKEELKKPEPVKRRASWNPDFEEEAESATDQFPTDRAEEPVPVKPPSPLLPMNPGKPWNQDYEDEEEAPTDRLAERRSKGPDHDK